MQTTFELTRLLDPQLLTPEQVAYYREVGLQIGEGTRTETVRYLSGYTHTVTNSPIITIKATRYPNWEARITTDNFISTSPTFQRVRSTRYGVFSGTSYSCPTTKDLIYQLDNALQEEEIFTEPEDLLIPNSIAEWRVQMQAISPFIENLINLKITTPSQIDQIVLNYAYKTQSQSNNYSKRVQLRFSRFLNPGYPNYDRMYDYKEKWAIIAPERRKWFLAMAEATNSLRSDLFSIFWDLDNAEFLNNKGTFATELIGQAERIQKTISEIESLITDVTSIPETEAT